MKLDQILELADKYKVQVIALQETKLKNIHRLKAKGFYILRKDRNREDNGGGLAFLIRDIKYKEIHLNINGTHTELEIQGIKCFINATQHVNIVNIYHPPNNCHLPLDFETIFEANTIILGDPNALHTHWGCSTTNNRGTELLELTDDKAFYVFK